MYKSSIIDIEPYFIIPQIFCPVGWGCRIHRLHLCRVVKPPPMSVLYMILNNLMVRFQ